MSKNKVMRAVPIFVGVLLCMALMQTAFAAQYSPNLNAAPDNPMVWNSPNLNTATDNPMVWNSPNLNAATDNPMVWNSPNLNAATDKPPTGGTTIETTETWTRTSDSVPSDLMNIFIPLQNS
jgi:hypothetical protein